LVDALVGYLVRTDDNNTVIGSQDEILFVNNTLRFAKRLVFTAFHRVGRFIELTSDLTEEIR